MFAALPVMIHKFIPSEWMFKNFHITEFSYHLFKLKTPNVNYSWGTAPLTSKRCTLYIYSTNIGTEYFKHGIDTPFLFSSKCSLFHNSKVFNSCIIHILYTGCAKIKKNNSGAKSLKIPISDRRVRNTLQKHVHVFPELLQLELISR
jgi:hypothetical protein